MLRMITPKGNVVHLGNANSMTGQEIQNHLEQIDAGKSKEINVLTKKGKNIRVIVTAGLTVKEIQKMADEFDKVTEKVEDVKKMNTEKGLFVADLRNLKGRYHTLKGCMGRAYSLISQAEINKDRRELCDRCLHRDAAKAK